MNPVSGHSLSPSLSVEMEAAETGTGYGWGPRSRLGTALKGISASLRQRAGWMRGRRADDQSYDEMQIIMRFSKDIFLFSFVRKFINCLKGFWA